VTATERRGAPPELPLLEFLRSFASGKTFFIHLLFFAGLFMKVFGNMRHILKKEGLFA